MEKKNKLVAITGASSGIGRAVAIEFAKRGYDLVIIARRKNLLEELKKEIEAKGPTKVHAIEADLGLIGALPHLEKKLADYQIDIFINNAGAGYRGYVVEQDPVRIAGILEVLVVALSYLTAAIGAQMARNGGGTIVNVASGLAYTSVLPSSAVYGAAKRYVWDFSRAVNYENTEVLKNNVKVVSVQPGAIESDFARVAQADPSKQANSRYVKTPTDEFAKAMVDGIIEGKTDFYYGSMAAELKEMGEKQTPAQYVRQMHELMSANTDE